MVMKEIIEIIVKYAEKYRKIRSSPIPKYRKNWIESVKHGILIGSDISESGLPH